VLPVAAEQLVGAHPREQDLHPRLPGRPADQVGVDGGGVADRLVERRHHPGQEVDHVGGDLDLVQLDAVAGCHLAGVVGVVGHGLETLVLGAEGDRVGVDGGVGPLGQNGDDAGVESAGEEGRHGHVGDQVGSHRLLDDGPEVGRRGTVGGGGGHVGQPPVVVELRGPVGPDLQPGAGRQLVDVLDDATLVGDPVVEHRRHQGPGLHLQLGPDGAHQRLQLRGEHHPVAPAADEEGLDPELVTGQEEMARALVEDGEGEHAPEPVEGGRPPPSPRLEHDLGVGAGPEAHPGGGQLGPQLPVVVELAVVDQGQAVAAEGLGGGVGEVDDRQAPVGQVGGHPVVDEGVQPGAVGPPVGHEVAHGGGQGTAVRLLVAPRDPAHGQSYAGRGTG